MQLTPRQLAVILDALSIARAQWADTAEENWDFDACQQRAKDALAIRQQITDWLNGFSGAR